MRAHEFITETKSLEEGRWNEEFLKNLLRALLAGVITFSGAEAKRLSTPLDTAALDTMVKQMTSNDQNKVVNIAKKAKQTRKISANDKMYLKNLIDRSVP